MGKHPSNKNGNRGPKPKQQQPPQRGVGKKRPGKPIFKVAGAKSLKKGKNKTQKLKLNLKKMQTATRNNTEVADQQLTKVEETLRNTDAAMEETK